jgi:hypothetical protein
MTRTGLATLIFLATYGSCAVADEPPFDPRLIGEWQNSGKGGKCQFFPGQINLTKDYVLRTNPYTATHGAIEGFEFENINEMWYLQAGPDGLDTCIFVRIDRSPGSPQP